MPVNYDSILVLTGPTGVGKTTIADRLVEGTDKIVRVTTTTTREPRPGEVDGRDYNFISREEFEEKIGRNEFVEWVEFNDDYYGTEKQALSSIQSRGHIPLLVLEIKGARFWKEKGAKAVFLSPESEAQLEKQLKNRDYDADTLEKRLKIAKNQMASTGDFELVVKNRFGSPEKASAEIEKLIN